jgi:hexosaminidase
LNEFVNIIPYPVNVKYDEGYFTLSDEIDIQFDEDFVKEANYLKNFTKKYLKINFGLPQSSSTNDKLIQIILSDENIPSEGYLLNIKSDSIQIKAKTSKGAFYGIQSLIQLLIRDSKISCAKIIDYPRFGWRGFMLDEARHFFGMEEVKKLIDVMALYKFNIFHWHLTDDQGWRIEIDEFPLLNEISSKRKGTSKGSRKLMADLDGGNKSLNGVPVSGLYTKSQIKELIRYAKDRFITIIPEVDFPGHVQAVLAAYPELSCTGGPFEVSVKFGVHKDVFCIGKEKVFDFSEKIFKEIISLFPSKIIHAGGDEVPIRRYKSCPDCQALMKKEQMTDEKLLQPYFTTRMAKFLEKNNRILMGWNEILNDNLPEKVISQFWAGDFNIAVDHIKKGRKTVMSDMRFVYLNYPSKLTPISKTYDYEPIPENLNLKYHKNILGIEACLWTEYVPGINTLEYQVFPRLIAVAETGWTLKENKNYHSFEQRLPFSLGMLEKMNVMYAKSDEYDIQY